jgi:hypothetical protein
MNHKHIKSVIACSIFKKEIESLIESDQLAGEFTYVDSDMHMFPQQLDKVLAKLIKPDCLLCYGTCHSRMAEQQNAGLIHRVNGLNCCEIFLGSQSYRKLRGEGAFFLLPEWTMKWEHVFKVLLGFSESKLASQFMNEMHTKFIYINTGISPVPHQTLEEISHYFSIPVETIDIDLVHLKNAIKEGYKLL